MALARFQRLWPRMKENYMSKVCRRAFCSRNEEKKMFKSEIPTEADVVVVGGGIIGCSVAYHLAKLGKDVVLLERDKITSGTTWHAAGLMVTFGSLSETSTEFRKYTKSLYQSLEEETGQSTGFKGCGFIELATNEDRLEEYRRVSTFNRKCGIDVQELTPDEILSLFPLCKVDDVLAGFYVEGDGRVNPVDAATALAKGAKMSGANIVENCPVTGVIKTKNGRAGGVTVSVGGSTQEIKAGTVVNCAGMWARQLGEMAGVCIPNQAAEHYYLITDEMEDVNPDWPVIEDPSSYTYIRPEGGGLLVGLFETEAAAWNVPRIPDNCSFTEISPDWDRMSPYLEKAMERVPRTLEVGAKNFFCGPESFTPDLAPIVGEAPELPGYFVGAGLNSIGILTGGGVGKLLAHWITYGEPDMDVTGINIDRLHPYMMNSLYRSHRVVESLGMVYQCHYPFKSMQSARDVKRSPIHSRLEKQGAYFKDVSGWEGADWYAGEGKIAEMGKLSFGKHEWFPIWKKEHDAVREGVGLIDMSFMSKFLVQGRDAGKMLNYLSTANVDEDSEMITYTQWLDDSGHMQADLTVTKMTDEKYFVVATDTMHRHVETWMKRHIGDQHVVVTDVTGAYAQINLQGPKSRDLLQSLTSHDVSNEKFPFRTAREIDIGYAKALCVRITYVGELGYEIYVPAENAVHVYDQIIDKGREFDLQHVGLKALSSLRMEKAYRDYGHDMDNTDTLLEVGLGFTCDFNKKIGFKGQEAVEKQKKDKSHLYKRLVQVLINDPDAILFHGEVLKRDGKVVGDIRAGSYGHTLGGAVGLSMVEADSKINAKYLKGGKW
eukprot:CAMPEP_0167743692 /NCGR_PEP_ID=MMETSP0110_2-20121227/2155_1 /TAXON_ID=629695 /ORGANISM="Gymnochlora sp., Strain CCMP2014" /LENGTH=829 /DNA_ID=CAMNT_0007628087 /DNA_START=623 /DNA_END=3109 /DNA_ORIENTATION=+